MIKKGDTIKVLAGKDKGKTGKVLQVLPKLNRVSAEGINVLTKHLRSSEKGKQGQKIEFPSPIHLSNVMLICPQCSKPTSIGYKLPEEASANPAKEGSSDLADRQPRAGKIRVCKKCKAEI